MTTIKRIVLDVLKPHRPDGLEFSTAVASRSPGCRLVLTVTAVDKQTESVVLAIEGVDLQYDAIATAISDLGGSVHSIDEVEVECEASEAE
jgi:hypothetical protein